MLTLNVRIGEAFSIGKVACVALDAKSGNTIKVRIATPERMQIDIIPTGLIPQIFVRGLTGERQPYRPPAVAPQSAAA